MEISSHLLEDAANLMYNGTLAEQQDAVKLFSAWQNSQNCLITASQLLSNQSSDQLQFLICCVILYASDQWFRYDRNMLNEIRSILLEFTFCSEHSPLIAAKLEEIVAKFAFNDWPEQWPEFLSQMKGFMKMNIKSECHVFMILAHFLKLISSSPKITLRRRAMMIQMFAQNIPDFVTIAEIENNEEDKDGRIMTGNQALSFLEFAEAVCMVIGSEDELCISFSQYLFDKFVVFDEFAPKALKAISKLISPSSYLTHLIPHMIEMIRNRENLNKPIIPEFHQFLCCFLLRFLDIAETFCTSQDAAASVLKLLQVSLTSASRNMFQNEFWTFWKECLTKIINNPSSPLISLVAPLPIISTFYEILPCSTQLSRLISPQTGKAFQLLAQIAHNETCSFLMEQQPSLSLCFAIGIIPEEGFLPKIKEIIERSREVNDINVLSAILYAVSRNISVMKNDPSLLSFLHYFSCTYLSTKHEEISLTDYFKLENNLNNITIDFQDCTDDEKLDLLQTSILLSLNHVASTDPHKLSNNQQFVEVLFNCASPQNLNPSNFSRLCRILAKVTLCTPPPLKNHYIEQLTNIAIIPLTSNDLSTIALGAHAAWAISSISLCGSYLITKYLWKPLISALQSNVNNEEAFSDLTAVFASSIRSAPWNLCHKVCYKFIHIAQEVSNSNNPKVSSVLDAYNLIFQCHYELTEFRDTFAETFIKLIQNSEPLPSFFEFFSIAGIKEHEESIVIKAGCLGLLEPDLNISRTAARMLKTFANKQKNPQHLLHWQNQIIQSVFSALFDDLHNPIIIPLSKVIFAIYKAYLKMNTLSDSIDQIIFNAIDSAVGDQGLTKDFAIALRNTASSKEDFLQLIGDFLISFGRFNPLEIKLFDDSLAVGSLTSRFHNTKIGNSIDEDEYVL